jgi:amino acid transporter
MWIAEVMGLAIFAVAFVNYLQYFIQLNFLQSSIVKGIFISALTFTNVIGVKSAGRINDILTLLKLSPLVLLMIAGLAFFAFNPNVASQNYSNFTPFGFGSFGVALVLIFWAYVGFELGTLPASEVRNPKKTIPKAIITGIAVVTLFYLLTNFVVFGLINWQDLSKTTIPLVLAGTALFGTIGAVIMSLGALVSVSGSDESGVLGTARLSYAMSLDGLFPKIFSKVHPKYRTPYMALIIQGSIAFILSTIAGIAKLISFSVFNFGFSFLLTCLALVILKKGSEKKLHGQNIVPWLGIIICLYLLYATSSFDKIVGSIVILLGVPIYIFLSPKQDIHHLKKMFLSEEAIFSRRLEKKEKFLANVVILLHKVYKKIK